MDDSSSPMTIELRNEDAQRNTTDEQETRCIKELKDRLRSHQRDQSRCTHNRLAEIKAKKVKAFNTHSAAHKKIMEDVSCCLTHCEALLKFVRNAYMKLKSQRMHGFPALEVCNLRQELLRKLPPSETLNDGPQKALEAELKLLEDSRAEMLDLENEGRSIVEELNSMRTRLLEGVGAWRFHSKQFISSLQVLSANEHTQQFASPLTMIKLRNAASIGSSPQDWDSSPEDAEHRENALKLVEGTGQLFSRSEQFYSFCGDLVQRIAREHKIALNLVESEMRKRATVLEMEKREREQQVVQSDRAILYAERNLDDIAREVHETGDGVARLEGDLQAVEELRKCRESSAEQVRIKFAAFEIYKACRRVTPTLADGIKQRRRARSLSNLRSPPAAPAPQQRRTSRLSTLASPRRPSPIGASGASAPRMSKGVSKRESNVMSTFPRTTTTAVSKVKEATGERSSVPDGSPQLEQAV